MPQGKIEKKAVKFPKMCPGCGGTSDLSQHAYSLSRSSFGYKYFVSGQLSLCPQCEGSARRERKNSIIGGIVAIVIGIVVFALADYLSPVLGYIAFPIVGLVPIIVGIFLFSRAFQMLYLANKFIAMKGVIKEGGSWRPKLWFKNASYQAAYESLN
ncbi:MAG TPA: hypothetical protein VKK79_02280 [Candidatus Lokiarchaeia archaeon]|nr:hypothetical protein [Candidatus Lokiarchaeia archaeon]